MFNAMTLIELDIIISGLRLVRRQNRDTYMRNKTSYMLQDALDARRFIVRKPQTIGVLA